MATKIAEYPVESIIISNAKAGIYGTTYSHQTSSKQPVLIDFGEMDTVFGGSQLKKDNIAQGKPKIELELGFEKDRSEHQHAVYKQVQKMRERIIDCLMEVEPKQQVLNSDDEPYTRKDFERMILNPVASKRGKTKKLNKISGKEEFPLYGPKLKISLKYAKVKRGSEYVDDTTKLYELYDESKPVGKRGNRLFFDEDGKPLSIKVDDLQESIPPNSTLRVYAMLAYTHIGELDPKGERTGYITFTPYTIKRLSVQSFGLQFPDTIFNDDSFNDETLEKPVEGTLSDLVTKAATKEETQKIKEGVYSEEEEDDSEEASEEEAEKE